jgi:uncharacterized protein (DUF1800 family)
MKLDQTQLWRIIVTVLVVSLSWLFFVNMQIVTPGITYAQLSGVNSNGVCQVRPTTGGSVYYKVMTAQGLSDVQILAHAATRMGYGLSPLGPLVAANANDCTTVFIADEIDRQLSVIGKNVDEPELQRLRRGLTPLTMFARADLDRAVYRIQQDKANDASVDPPYLAHSELAYNVSQDVAVLQALRNMLGSQAIIPNGTLVDHQMNLQEQIGEFWFNHFNVESTKTANYFGGSDGFIESLRPKLGGTFYELLVAAIKHPAMLVYLDNDDNFFDASTGAASNQNLARELMELHTFGVGPKTASTDSPYTQGDVEAMAGILAGWNVVPYTDQVNPGDTVYNATLAAPDLTWLGTKYSSAQSRLNTVLRVLANHAQTKSNICQKLVAHFVAGSGATAVQSNCLNAWGDDGDLGAMYAAIFRSPEFWSRANYRTLFRTPIEIPIAAARGIGVNLTDFLTMVNKNTMTEDPFTPASLTARSFVNANRDLTSQSVSWTLRGINEEIRSLMGVYRNQIVFPIGYSDVGEDALSSAYLDQTSRVAFDISVLLEGLNWDTRQDVVSQQAKTKLAAQLQAGGATQAAQYFFENLLKVGQMINLDTLPGSPAPPYHLPVSQQSIIKAVANQPASWPYWLDGNGVNSLEKALASLAFSNADGMKK